jgi:hypothetical protein
MYEFKKFMMMAQGICGRIFHKTRFDHARKSLVLPKKPVPARSVSCMRQSRHRRDSFEATVVSRLFLAVPGQSNANKSNPMKSTG